MPTRTLTPIPLTPEAFAPFGDVIATAGHEPRIINEGLTERYHDLAKVETTPDGGHALINIFRSTPKPLPITVTSMERHPLGSQAFMPLEPVPFLVLVADDPSRFDTYRFFITNSRQGVNYRRDVWHHYCLALEQRTDFLVVDRGGPGNNLEEFMLPEGDRILLKV
jgi:ureidoglycolate lyase